MDAATLAVVGHRGAMGVEPENTVRSFARALRDGADAIELDLRLSRDNALVIMHDAAVDRTTDGTGPIADLSLAEIKKLDAGEGERVPTFEEVLDVLGEARMQAEVKAPEAMPLLARVLEERGLTAQVTVTSFHASVLEEARATVPWIRRGFICSKAPLDAVDRAVALDAELVCPEVAHLAPEFVRRAHERGLDVCAWPANGEDEIRKAAELGAAAVTTDFPGRAVAIRQTLTAGG